MISKRRIRRMRGKQRAYIATAKQLNARCLAMDGAPVGRENGAKSMLTDQRPEAIFSQALAGALCARLP